MIRFELAAAAVVGACTLAAGCQQPPSAQVQPYPQQMPAYQQPQMPTQVQPQAPTQMQPQGSSYQQVPGGSMGASAAGQVQGYPQQSGSPSGQPLEYASP